MSFSGRREKGDNEGNKLSFPKCCISPEVLVQNLGGNTRQSKLFLGDGDGAIGGWRIAADPPAACRSNTCL